MQKKKKVWPWKQTETIQYLCPSESWSRRRRLHMERKEHPPGKAIKPSETRETHFPQKSSLHYSSKPKEQHYPPHKLNRTLRPLRTNVWRGSEHKRQSFWSTPSPCHGKRAEDAERQEMQASGGVREGEGRSFYLPAGRRNLFPLPTDKDASLMGPATRCRWEDFIRPLLEARLCGRGIRVLCFTKRSRIHTSLYS